MNARNSVGMPSLRDSQEFHLTPTTDFILIFTHIFLNPVVLVLNEMVLVLVLDSSVAIEHEHRHTTEHEHEITNKSNESRSRRT